MEIKSIQWESGRLSIRVWSRPDLNGHHLDFANRGGALALRLDFDDAAKTWDESHTIYTWGVCTQPWITDDRLLGHVSDSDENTLTHTTNDALPCSAIAPKPALPPPPVIEDLVWPPIRSDQAPFWSYKMLCAEPSCMVFGLIVFLPTSLCLLHTVMTIRLQVRRRRGLE